MEDRPAVEELEPGLEVEEPEQPASAATSSGEESTSSDPLADYFVRHKLTKRDTLAGLAVRYNVTVSDIKRANGFLADTAMFAKDTLLIPTRPLPVGPEYSAWAGMIVMHYGRLGPSDESAPSDSLCAQHFSQTRAMQQLRGYYSTGPSRSQSPQYASGAEDSDRQHLYASGRRGTSGGSSDWAHLPGQVELMERTSPARAAASYIEERLRRRGRGDSQAEEAPASSSSTGAGSGGGGSSFGLFPQRPPLFGDGSSGAALASAGGRQLRQWKETLLQKLKKVASQPALAVPPGAGTSMQQLGHAAVATAPGLGTTAAGEARQDRPSMRQRASSGSGGHKAD